MGVGAKFGKGMRFAFGELLTDLVPWLVAGIVVAGAIAALIPEGWINAYLGTGLTAYGAMLLLGIPMYICATASTPIAAALMLKGLGPGAALVLLLVGPATNAASIIALSRMLGVATTVRYLASIAVTAVLVGMGADWLYGAMSVDPAVAAAAVGKEHGALLGLFSVAVLVAVCLRAYIVRPKSGGCCSSSSCGD